MNEQLCKIQVMNLVALTDNHLFVLGKPAKEQC